MVWNVQYCSERWSEWHNRRLIELLQPVTNISYFFSTVILVMKKFAWFVVVSVLLSACKNSEDYKKIVHDPLLFCNTVHELNNVVMGNNFSPVVASRNYTYANIAAYEVIATGDKNYQSLAGQLNGLTAVPKPTEG